MNKKIKLLLSWAVLAVLVVRYAVFPHQLQATPPVATITPVRPGTHAQVQSHDRPRVLTLCMSHELSEHWAASEKKELLQAYVQVDDGPRLLADFRLWGQGAARLKHTRRRSFSLDVKNGTLPGPKRSGLAMRRAVLLSLFEDKYRLAYMTSVRALQPLRLWFPSTQYVEVRCSAACGGTCPAATFGVYMLVEEVQDAIARHHAEAGSGSGEPQEVHIAFRMTDKNKREQLVAEDPQSAPLIAGYNSMLADLDHAGQYIPLRDYLRWLASNTILRNGDYIDEVLFYTVGDQKDLRLMGWDYDSVFEPCHDVPLRYRLKRVGDPVMYCAESKLDHHIHLKPELMLQYRAVLRSMLLYELTPEVWNSAVDSSLAELQTVLQQRGDPKARASVIQATWEQGKAPDVVHGAVELKESFARQRQELIGLLQAWPSLFDVFRTWDALDIPHVVLRNFEELNQNVNHPDIDVLTANYTAACEILLLRPEQCKVDRSRPMLRKVKAGDKAANFDFTFIGDNYYFADWQRDMLRTRKPVFSEEEAGQPAFHVLSPENHFYSLLYHALLHKPKVAADYKGRLQTLGASVGVALNVTNECSMLLELDRFMVNNGYSYVKPQNPFVAWQDAKAKPWAGPCKNEQHLIILWDKARALEQKLMDEVRSRFSVQSVHNITWPKECFLETMTKFYGKSRDWMAKKVERCGNDQAVAVVFRDVTPEYRPRRTSSGTMRVNVNVFDLKQNYREALGKHYNLRQKNLLGKEFYMDCFHGTNNKQESDHDLKALFQDLGLDSCPSASE